MGLSNSWTPRPPSEPQTATTPRTPRRIHAYANTALGQSEAVISQTRSYANIAMAAEVDSSSMIGQKQRAGSKAETVRHNAGPGDHLSTEYVTPHASNSRSNNIISSNNTGMTSSRNVTGGRRNSATLTYSAEGGQHENMSHVGGRAATPRKELAPPATAMQANDYDSDEGLTASSRRLERQSNVTSKSSHHMTAKQGPAVLGE